jgi:hypothetical protein
MGTWDSEPCANDSAGDWIGELMDATCVRDRWLEGITADFEVDFESSVPRRSSSSSWAPLRLADRELRRGPERTITALRAVQKVRELSQG